MYRIENNTFMYRDQQNQIGDTDIVKTSDNVIFFFEQYYEYFEAWIVDRFSEILNGSYDKWFL